MEAAHPGGFFVTPVRRMVNAGRGEATPRPFVRGGHDGVLPLPYGQHPAAAPYTRYSIIYTPRADNPLLPPVILHLW